MERKITTYGGYFEAFMESLDDKTQQKIEYALGLLRIQHKVSKKFVKFVREDLYELRVEWESNIYRVFFIFDNGNIVVLFNGFQKKTQKTPNSEINKALTIKKEYYASKR